MIVGSGSFYGHYTDPLAYYDKTTYGAHWQNKYFLADDQSEISSRFNTAASTTSFIRRYFLRTILIAMLIYLKTEDLLWKTKMVLALGDMGLMSNMYGQTQHCQKDFILQNLRP
ncbi:MAG: hypothetical protein IPM97_05445 [Bdellovibrionaceae bacterium]|nr:hypothetical protein [Pseudobdellovibrionaceae bacterium]